MPTIEENREEWSSYRWPEEGDEWSSQWGTTTSLWYGTIFPRIMAFLPAHSILEIAPGYGRCTQFLLAFCKELTLVDLTENCITACRKRFEKYTHVNYFVNDGKSLDMLENDSLDFVFSWDSLVHAECDVLSSYLKQLCMKLKEGGYGFIHHSNIGAFKHPETGNLLIENLHWRAESMTAALFREYCDEAGLTCVSQEIIGWGGGDGSLTDCFSLFSRGGQKVPGKTTVFENRDFMQEAFRMKQIGQLFNPAIMSREFR